MTGWSTAAVKKVLVPGGIILPIALLFIQYSWIPSSPSGIAFFYYAVFVAALALALRFRSMRVVFAAMTFLLAHYGLVTKGPNLHEGAGKLVFEAAAILLPLDFLLLTFLPERTLRREQLFGMSAILFFQFTSVAIFARPGQTSWSWLHFSLIHAYHLHLPQPAVLVFFVALGFLLWRLLRFGKAIDHGMFWSLLSACIAMETGGSSKSGTEYFAIAGLILASSVVENSYSLAFRDELTGLHSRRAFNDALLRLKAPYAIAEVDIDHFKNINDTYGHDTGDQVLRLVASRISMVSGGGQAYRVGGEEFTVLFPGRTAKEVFDPLELLRMDIESCSFRLRRQDDRRKTPRESDRRAGSGRKLKARKRVPSDALSVTVSIGIAESRSNLSAEQVIETADKALYAAKQGGRNRIEVASAEKKKGRKARASPTPGS
jgi:diguanylate cyclase (GGDEF)-like protein